MVETTIQVRLLVMATVCAACLTAMIVVAGLSSRAQAASAARLTQVSKAMSAQWDADMMHDAIRGDVMAAVGPRTEAQRTAYSIDEVAGHTAELVRDFD